MPLSSPKKTLYSFVESKMKHFVTKGWWSPRVNDEGSLITHYKYLPALISDIVMKKGNRFTYFLSNFGGLRLRRWCTMKKVSRKSLCEGTTTKVWEFTSKSPYIHCTELYHICDTMVTYEGALSEYWKNLGHLKILLNERLLLLLGTKCLIFCVSSLIFSKMS